MNCSESEENLAEIDLEVESFLEQTLRPGAGPGSPPGRGEKTPLSEGEPLPCLYCNNVTRTTSKAARLSARFASEIRPKQREKAYLKRYLGRDLIQAYDRKVAQSLFLNAGELLGRGIERIAFVTITTSANNSYWKKEGWQKARSLFRSWIGHKTGFKAVFGPGRDWFRVIEPQGRGAIHWHMMIDTGEDIRTGVDFEAFNRGDYRSAPPALRRMWARMRESCKRYHLGRSSIEPIKSDKWEAAARYVGKYISKGIVGEVKQYAEKGDLRPDHARRVGYSSGWKTSNTSFMWLESGESWRKGVGILAGLTNCETLDDLRRNIGKRWAFRNRELVHALASGEPLTEEHLKVLHALTGCYSEESDPEPF